MDLAGNKLDQSGDGVFGGEDDGYSNRFSITEIDLKVADVKLEKTVFNPGEMLTVGWTDYNNGGYALSGSWTDGIYLSADSRWDVNDILLGSLLHEGGLQQDEQRSNALSVSLAGVSEGTYYLLVRSDIYMQEKGEKESALAAQNLEAVQIKVELPTLTVDSASAGTISKSGDYAVYKLKQNANESLKLVLDSDIDSANMEIYVGNGYVPTREKYDSKVQKISDGSLLLPAGASAQNVYVMVYGKSTSQAFDYTLTAESVPMSITTVKGLSQSNEEGSSFDISGVDFSPSTKVWLSDQSGKRYEADVSFVDSTRIVATVAGGTLADGKYSLSVEEDGETMSYAEDITIKNGAKPILKASFYAPGTVGRHAAATLTVTCTNTGDAPMDAFMVTVAPTQSHASGPDTTGAILTLDSSKINSGFWTSSMPDGFSTSVSFMVEGAESSQIMPGETVTKNIYYLGWRTDDWDFGNSHINWNVSYLTDTDKEDGSSSKEPIDWNNALSSATYSDATKEKIAANLAASVGTTWGDYVRMLNQNQRHVDALGEETKGLAASDLFKFEVMQDTGVLSPYNTLQSSVDVSLDVSGALSLAVSRSYRSDILSRDSAGSMGYGWTTNLDTRLQIDSSGDLIFVQGSAARTYQPDFSNGYQTVSGDGSVMKKTSSGYKLTEYNGTVHTFDASGKLLTTTDTNGNKLSYTYGADGKISKVSHSSGASITVTRNASGMITSLTGSDGQVVSYTYDGSGNMTKATESRGGTSVSYQYSETLAHAMTGMTDASGASCVYTYDDAGLLSGISTRNGAYTVSLAYDRNGEVTLSDTQNNKATYYYDTNACLCKAKNEVSGVTVYFKYDNSGNLVNAYDSRGNSTSFTYDGVGNVTASSDINGNTVTMKYNGSGYAVSVKDERGVQTDYAYDAKNNLTAAYYADGSMESFTYDSVGNLRTATDRKGNVTTYTCDGSGRVTKSVCNGRTTSYSYDNAGNLVGITYADGTASAYAYNGLDLMTKFTDASGNATNYTYDSIGNLTKITYADGSSESYAYNANNDLTAWTNRRGETVQYTVDALGNTTQIAQADGTSYSFAYDASGRITAAGDLNFTYDQYDLVTSVVSADGKRSIAYTYDSQDRVVSISDGVNTTNYTYTVYGEIDTLTSASGKLIADYDYNRFGNLEKVTNGNGTYTVYSYNDLQELTSIENFDKAGVSTGKTAYAYNADGQIATKTTADGTWAYTYDNVGQLTSATLTKDGATLRSEAYTYDDMGNRLSATIDGVTTTYTYNNLNQIVSANDFAYRYDRDGNLLEDEKRTYTWTTDNRVASETDKSTGQTWTYGYDALGNRTSVTTNGVTTTYTVDANGNVLAEYVNGVFSRSYIQGNLLVAFTDVNGNTYYYNSDVLGSTTGITDSSGVTVNSYSYDSFGNVLTSTEGVANDFEFVGGYGLMSNASGTTFVRARNYDAATGRWISADPIGISGGENLYVYCGNDGVNCVDSLGCAIMEKPEYSSNWSSAQAEHSADCAKIWDTFAGVVVFGLVGAAIGGVPGAIVGGLIGLGLGAAYGEEIPVTGSTISYSTDPNDKTVQEGFGEKGYVTADATLNYKVEFENEADATAPARWVRVYDVLADEFDVSTFELKSIYIAGNYIEVGDGRDSFNETRELNIMGEKVLTKIAVNLEENDDGKTQIHAEFTAIDPETGFMEQDVTKGLLFPENETGRGQGFFEYDIALKDGVAHDTAIENTAKIYFDFNDPIDTPTTLNTVDSVKPTLTGFELASNGDGIVITMDGSDADSGIYGYNIAISADGENFLALATATENTYTVNIYPEDVYYFIVQAVDNVGNVSDWSDVLASRYRENDDWADMKTAGPDGNFDIFRKFAAGASYADQVGKEDPVDYREFTLDSAASLNFTVSSENAAKFTIYSLQSKTDKKGVTTYSLKSLQSTSLKAGQEATTKSLLLEKGTYYIGVDNADKKKSDADYTVSVSDKSTFFTKGDNSDDWTTMKTAGAAGLPASAGTVDASGELLNGWVGFGDAIDYTAFTLDSAANLAFNLNVTDAAKFTVYSLQSKTDKKGVTTYSLKSLQSTSVKVGDATTKNLLLEKGTYYLAVESTNAKKGGSVDYSVSVSDKTMFFTRGDNGDDWTDVKTAGADGLDEKYDMGAVGESTSYLLDDWVGYGDAIDYREFTLDSAANLAFDLNVTDATKFTVYSLQSKTDKKGVTTYSLKSLQSTTLKAGDSTTKNLLLEKGTYYFAVESTNAKKGGSVDYTASVSDKTTFFTKGDNSDDWTDMKTAGAASLEDPVLVGEETKDLLNGWVGYGDAVDYKAFTLDRAADIVFDLDVTDAAKFSIFSLQEKTDKKGVTTYSLKSLQSTTLKAGESSTKSLRLEEGTYYLAMESTNAKKGGSADYIVSIDDKTTFDAKKGFLAGA